MLKTVTITGADDGTLISDLFELSKEYPFVEWAILVSRSSKGSKRFPSHNWIEELVHAHETAIINGEPGLNLSLHLCGAYVRELLSGSSQFIDNDLLGFWQGFQRVQINTHGQEHLTVANFADALLRYPDKEFIFQFDDVNQQALDFAIMDGANCSALFDLSHGAGVLPEYWPLPLEDIKCGYAGGISPANIVQQIIDIEKTVGDIPVWIDMETHVRSDNDKLFDLDKVKQCLRLSAPYIK